MPSQLVGLSSSTKIFYFDRAIWRFGTKVENALNEVENSKHGKGKPKSQQWVTLNRQRVLDKYLGATEAEKAKRYKDPAVSLGGKPSSAPASKVKMQDERTEIELGANFLV